MKNCQKISDLFGKWSFSDSLFVEPFRQIYEFLGSPANPVDLDWQVKQVLSVTITNESFGSLPNINILFARKDTIVTLVEAVMYTSQHPQLLPSFIGTCLADRRKKVSSGEPEFCDNDLAIIAGLMKSVTELANSPFLVEADLQAFDMEFRQMMMDALRARLFRHSPGRFPATFPEVMKKYVDEACLNRPRSTAHYRSIHLHSMASAIRDLAEKQEEAERVIPGNLEDEFGQQVFYKMSHHAGLFQKMNFVSGV